MACGAGDKQPGKCIYGLPFCGGLCAPTENPDESCYRHGSNEWTLPLGAGGPGPFMKCSPCIEMNCCCRSAGKIGFACGDRNRKPFMTCGVFINILSMLLGLIGCLGITDQASNIEAFSWVSGEAQASKVNWKMYMGATAKVDTIDTTKVDDANFFTLLLKGGWTEQGSNTWQKVTRFDAMDCAGKAFEGEATEAQKDFLTKMKNQCEQCRDSSITTFSLVMGVFGGLPSLMTNLQRSTRFGDVNCQAFMGSVFAIFSILMTTTSMTNYADACKKSMPDQGLDTQGNLVDVTFRLGIGFQCILVGTLIKIIDVFLHFLVPTPRGRWMKADPPPANLLEYLNNFDGYTSGKVKDVGEPIGAPDQQDMN